MLRLALKRGQRAGPRAVRAAVVEEAVDAQEREADQRRPDERERDEQPDGAQAVRLTGAERDAARVLRREVAHRPHLRLPGTERRERRDRHERVDEPALADRAQIDVEDDRSLLAALPRLQLELEPDLLARHVEDVPRVRLPLCRERVDGQVAAAALPGPAREAGPRDGRYHCEGGFDVLAPESVGGDGVDGLRDSYVQTR